MSYYNIVAETSENTVVTTYEPEKTRSEHYQNEAELEKEFIKMLTEQGYEYLKIHTQDDLISNLRLKLEELNNYKFTDNEWNQFFNTVLANKNDKIEDKTQKIQEGNSVQVLIRDEKISNKNSTKNITLIDKQNIHNNRLQVINQYEVSKDQGANHDNRYDVTILVNGLPLVHIELKRRGERDRKSVV